MERDRCSDGVHLSSWQHELKEKLVSNALLSSSESSRVLESARSQFASHAHASYFLAVSIPLDSSSE
jgi:hypothetical protein